MKKYCVDLLMVLAVFGVLFVSGAKQDMTREEQSKLIVRVAIQAFNEGDWQTLSEVYSPRFVQHRPGEQKNIKWKDFELGCRLVHNRLPTLRLEILDIIAEGDKVAVRLKTVVTFKESESFYLRGPGKVEMTEIDIFRVAGGRIVEEWCESDTEDWTNKLGKLKYVKVWK